MKNTKEEQKLKSLSKMKCRACEGLEDKLTAGQIKSHSTAIKDWKVIDNHHLLKDFKFKNFKEALAFVNKVGAIAESEGHHPDIELGWGRASIKLYTHFINGLSINDFILASKIDEISKA